MSLSSHAFGFDPAPAEVNKSLSIDSQERLDVDRPTKSVVFGQNSSASPGQKAAQRGCKYFRMGVYTCAVTADSVFLSEHNQHYSRLLGFNWLEQF